MNIDFEFWFSLAVLVTGLMTALNYFVFAKRRAHAGITKEPRWVEYGRGFFWPLLIVLILRSFVMQFVLVPTSSLAPTVIPAELLFVQEYAYGLRLPIIHTKILAVNQPKVGDLAVFRWPDHPDTLLVKRVIGTPGDKIAYRNKTLYINGVRAQQKTLGFMYEPDIKPLHRVEVRREKLGKADHDILLRVDGYRDKDFELEVPAGRYFMMGDNRDNSNDSRIWGFVPEANLVGKPTMVMLSWDKDKHRIRWARSGVRI